MMAYGWKKCISLDEDDCLTPKLHDLIVCLFLVYHLTSSLPLPDSL